METLIGASRVDSTSSITVASELGDPRFLVLPVMANK